MGARATCSATASALAPPSSRQRCDSPHGRKDSRRSTVLPPMLPPSSREGQPFDLETLRPAAGKKTLRGFVRSSPASALLWPEGLKRAQDQYYHQRKTNLILRRAFDLLQRGHLISSNEGIIHTSNKNLNNVKNVITLTISNQFWMKKIASGSSRRDLSFQTQIKAF